MNASVAIVDYQMGNLRSVQKAIEKVGGNAIVTDDPSQIQSASHVILPGVGAFGDAMRELQQRHLVPVMQQAALSGKPFLGICLGMQLLFASGEEGGEQIGLGIIEGSVPKFEIDPALKVPHMGWNKVASKLADDPLMQSIPSDPYFYFVHSYFCQPVDTSVVWLECDYGGPFCAAIRKDNIFATQFHPEKSQANGLRLLQNFIELK